MFKKALFVLSLFASLDFSCAAMDREFQKGDVCRIVSGPLAEILAIDNKIVEIDSTCFEMFGINTVEEAIEKTELWGSTVLTNYFFLCLRIQNYTQLREKRGKPLESYLCQEWLGFFYYGKLKKRGRGLFLHPSWLMKIEENS